MSNTPAETTTKVAGPSGAQQSTSVEAQQSRVAVPEQNSVSIPVRGVTDNEIRFGISAPFSGAAKELGQNMKLGIEVAFNVANANGGVHGRQLRLVSVDDGYEPAWTA
jgi:ABC-type branched-subunit amino acid transport system substrate-binding protein